MKILTGGLRSVRRSLLSTWAGGLLPFVDVDFVGDEGRLEGCLRFGLGGEPKSGGTRSAIGCSRGVVKPVSSYPGDVVTASCTISRFSLSLKVAAGTLACARPLVTI